MSCSVGAVEAAESGRGNRNAAMENDEYRLILPNLPSGRSVLNTVFMHGDVRARPLRVEDFRDTLDHLRLLPEVVALGAYQMNHVWAVTFRSDEGTKRLLASSDVKVKGRRCVVIDPTSKDLRIKVHWLLYNTADEDVRAAFLPYGRVTDITRERWRVNGVTDKGSTTRTVTLKLKSGINIEDIPHQLRVAGEQALVVVPGRAPLCLRCGNTGHIRRDCRVPRCGQCRRYGHEDAVCARSYASVTAPARTSASEDTAELIMDEADAEEAAGSTPRPASTEDTEGRAASVSLTSQAEKELMVMDIAETSALVAATPTAEASKGMEDVTGENLQVDELAMEASSGTTGKRAREDMGDNGVAGDAGVEEPPSKALPPRRSALRPRPNIPPDRRPAASSSS